jgi:hypothetical protein
MKKSLTQMEMEMHSTMSAGQLEKFACFLEMHSRFYPELKGENAVISGFRVGGCFLSVDEMFEFISSRPEATLLPTVQPTRTDRRLP